MDSFGHTGRKPTAISLFAGGGGMTLGLEQAGFETLFATDVEPSAGKTFSHNFPEVPFLVSDIRRMSRTQLEHAVGGRQIDLVAGGPPCQGFSTLGDQNPADPRNGLFWCFLRVVQWLNPASPGYPPSTTNPQRLQHCAAASANGE
jgi:DNA (cytosine-5)-methyltransferase 1